MTRRILLALPLALAAVPASAQSLCPGLITFRTLAATAGYSQSPGTGTCTVNGVPTVGCLTAAEYDANENAVEELLCKGGIFSAITLTGPVTSNGLATAIGNNQILAAMLAFNYAGSSSEGGAATSAETAETGDSATAFFSTGTLEDARIAASIARDSEIPTETDLEGVLDLQDLQGAVTDGQIPAAIARDAELPTAVAGDVDGAFATTDLDEAAVETELESVLDLPDLQGVLTDGQIPAIIARDSELPTDTDDQDADDVPYAPAQVGDWVDPDPAQVAEALDDLGERLTTEEAKADDDVGEAGDFGALALSGDVTSSGLVTTVADDSHAHGASTISGLDAGDVTTGSFGDARVDGSLEGDEVAIGGDGSGTAAALVVTDDSHAHTTTTISGLDAADLTTGTIGHARLGTGGGGATKFLREDSTFQTIAAGSGDVVGPASATADAFSLFSGTTGKIIKNSTLTTASNCLQLGGTSSAFGCIYIANTTRGEVWLLGADGSVTAGKSGKFVVQSGSFSGDNPVASLNGQTADGILDFNANGCIRWGSTSVAGVSADSWLCRGAAGQYSHDKTAPRDGLGTVEGGKYVSTVSTLTIADNGTGAAATGTLTPTTSYVAGTCSDPHGCDTTFAEPGPEGTILTFVNVSANAFNFADTSGISELPAGGISLAQYDALTAIYISDRWVRTGGSDN